MISTISVVMLGLFSLAVNVYAVLVWFGSFAKYVKGGSFLMALVAGCFIVFGVGTMFVSFAVIAEAIFS